MVSSSAKDIYYPINNSSYFSCVHQVISGGDVSQQVIQEQFVCSVRIVVIPQQYYVNTSTIPRR